MGDLGKQVNTALWVWRNEQGCTNGWMNKIKNMRVKDCHTMTLWGSSFRNGGRCVHRSSCGRAETAKPDPSGRCTHNSWEQMWNNPLPTKHTWKKSIKPWYPSEKGCPECGCLPGGWQLQILLSHSVWPWGTFSVFLYVMGLTLANLVDTGELEQQNFMKWKEWLVQVLFLCEKNQQGRLYRKKTKERMVVYLPVPVRTTGIHQRQY